MQVKLMDNLFGRNRMGSDCGVAYFVYNKRTSEGKECASQEEALGAVEAWLDTGTAMHDVVIYSVDNVLVPTPAPSFKMRNRKVEDVP
jgi:hypothetical protein